MLLLASCVDQGRLFQAKDPQGAGIDFQNTLTETDDFNILDYLYFYNGGGVAIGDINNDGLPDLYFSGNQVSNKLYLNKGDLQFEDITQQAGVAGSSDWNTGAVMGDVNGDGLLDLYVCAVVGLRGLGGYNELFINNGDLTFTEKAAEYGLDHDSYSSSAAFLDFDRDGDLDIFLLNHAVHTQESFGHARLREIRTYETGDKLLRNDNGKFVDVSESAGIYGGVNSYGLGVAISDFNSDGWPDIYVGNDFHEDDYYYLNNGDGTYTESLKKYFGHITRFSMGNDVADINHDGLPDLISLDMLPEDEKVLKSSEGDDDVNIQRLRIQRYGYHYQFSRNMLHINGGDNMFAETALLSNVAATDWSWSALFADWNQDGEEDLFIANGIPRRPNDLDYIKFVSSDQIKSTIDATKLVDQQALELMPSGTTQNYLFIGSETLAFSNETKSSLPQEQLNSTSAAWGDLDNDGDLDLVINNVNSRPSLYINQSDPEQAKYLKLSFDHPGPNTHGIGTKVWAWQNGKLQYKELYTVRGFQASSESIIHFGFGNASQVDSLRIAWPNGESQILTDVKTNQSLTLSPEPTEGYRASRPETKALFQQVPDNLGIDNQHREDRYIDFDRQQLMPFQVSDRGPAVAYGDLNNDGLDDLYFGSAKYFPSRVFLQQDTGFKEANYPLISSDSIKEDLSAVIGDFDGDGKNDLLVGTGGADFYNKMNPLLDSYYLSADSGFKLGKLPERFENVATIRAADYDQDGDLDVFMGSHTVSNDYGKIPGSALLNNTNGQFKIVENPGLENVGMVTDAIWSDFDQDGDEDLMVVGEWMPPTFFQNDAGQFKSVNLTKGKLNGLWQAIIAFDIDQDGDDDYLLGNWGENSKFKASSNRPMKMYYADFDANGSTETIVATEKGGKYYSLEGLDGLSAQMVSLRKKYTAYKDFAGQTVEEILGKEALKEATILEVHTLSSGYLKNNNGQFEFYPFETALQLAPITDFVVFDFDGDGTEEALAGGNYFGVKPYHGRFGSFSGALIESEGNIKTGSDLGLDLMNRSVRDLSIIEVGNRAYLLVTINNESTQVYQINTSK